MKLIVGLGNPGRLYADSRHNIGFLLVKALAKTFRVHLRKDTQGFSLSGRGKAEGENLILAMPLTFMNLSGNAVSALIKKYKIDLNNLLVVSDDLDLEFGKFKIKASGSSGGHRGLQSIIDALKENTFCRLRIGVGRPAADTDAAEYVLSAFNKKEKAELKEIIERAENCCRIWVAKGASVCMNNFNRRSKRKMTPSMVRPCSPSTLKRSRSVDKA